jgi:hypothetical protein
MESVFLLKYTYRNEIKVEKRKHCEKEKNKKRKPRSYLNISNNSPRILVAEKITKKKPFSAYNILD